MTVTASTNQDLHYLTKDETRRLLAKTYVRSVRDHAIWTTAYWHGMRVSEVGLLTPADVRLDAARIYIRRLKGSNSGEYPMSPDEVTAMRAWLKIRKHTPGPLFVSSRGDAISRQRLHNLMRVYCELADIAHPKNHFHVLRHSIAVHMADMGKDVSVIQDWLGHRSITSTMIYMKITNISRIRTARDIFGEDETVGTVETVPTPRPKINWSKDKQRRTA
jgi:type 1 fimbriae regulatory protein FimB